MIIILVIVALLFLVIWLWKLFKIPKIGCVGLVTGGVKTGKSMLSVWLSVRKYKRTVFAWKIKCFLCRVLRKIMPEKPLFYSNVPIAGVDYVLIPVELLERRVFRPAYKSVIYIQEASLLADSMYFKDLALNERLLLFNKLIGHQTRGGYLIYDTQAICDNHYAVKRCLSSYFWIHHNIKIPFFCVLFVREMFYSADDSTTVNTVGQDVETDLKIIVIPKRVWKMYDAYCYSALTDDLEIYEKTEFIPVGKAFRSRLKIKTILSFKEYMSVDTFRGMADVEKIAEKGYMINTDKFYLEDLPLTIKKIKGVKVDDEFIYGGEIPLCRKT